jgi:hypothetical protein
MKLVSSNDGKLVEESIQQAMAQYWSDKNITRAMDGIAKLKGIGPATASLLLSVHDPEQVIFFSDEAFWWLCCGGQKSPIKYNAKEYQQLNVATHKIAERLQVGATDIEKAAYVIMNDGPSQLSSTSEPRSKPSKVKSKSSNEALPKAPAKRKGSSVLDTDNKPLRRSQRQKVA